MRAEILRTDTIFSGSGRLGGYFWPSVARLADGSVMAVSSGSRLAHLCPFGRLTVAYSKDEGKHWSKEKRLLSTGTDERDAGLCVFGKDVYVTTFNNTMQAQKQFCELMSWDEETQILIDKRLKENEEAIDRNLGSFLLYGDGYDFSEPKRIPLTTPHGPFVFNGGVALVGRAFPYYSENSEMYLRDGIYFMSLNKTDFGKPRLIVPQGENGYNLYEPHAVTLNNGDILLAVRAERNGDVRDGGLFTILTCVSKDGGETFSPLEETGIEGSPPHLYSVDGNIVMTYGRRKFPFGIRAKITKDGKSWSDELIVRNDGIDFDLGYPSTCSLKDGSLYTVYYMKSKKNANSKVYGTKWRITN